MMQVVLDDVWCMLYLLMHVVLDDACCSRCACCFRWCLLYSMVLVVLDDACCFRWCLLYSSLSVPIQLAKKKSTSNRPCYTSIVHYLLRFMLWLTCIIYPALLTFLPRCSLRQMCECKCSSLYRNLMLLLFVLTSIPLYSYIKMQELSNPLYDFTEEGPAWVYCECSLVFYRVHSCLLVFNRVLSCSLVFSRVDSCSSF